MIQANCMSLFLIFCRLLEYSTLQYNKLIRVDGISPTCLEKSKCKEYTEVGSVISVDKSLPYMGSNYCCFQFKLPEEFAENGDNGKSPLFMGQILNTTILEGDDFITFFEGESFKMTKNVTSSSLDPYSPLFFKSPIVSVEIYKDRNYRSIYEIAITLYHQGDSTQCKSKAYHRCSSNTSICISDTLMCDKFAHCPNESDEMTCELFGIDGAEISRLTVMIIVSIISATFILTTVVTICLTFIDNCDIKLPESLIKVFGDSGLNNKDPEYYIEEIDTLKPK